MKENIGLDMRFMSVGFGIVEGKKLCLIIIILMECQTCRKFYEWNAIIKSYTTKPNRKHTERIGSWLWNEKTRVIAISSI